MQDARDFCADTPGCAGDQNHGLFSVHSASIQASHEFSINRLRAIVCDSSWLAQVLECRHDDIFDNTKSVRKLWRTHSLVRVPPPEETIYAALLDHRPI